MITEDYVSWETGKLMGENGFDQDYPSAYYDCRIIDGVYIAPVPRPTLQTAVKWLRKVHNIDVWVEWHNKRYKGNIHSEQRGNEALFYEDSPEEACEAAIKYCLENLI